MNQSALMETRKPHSQGHLVDVGEVFPSRICHGLCQVVPTGPCQPRLGHELLRASIPALAIDDISKCICRLTRSSQCKTASFLFHLNASRIRASSEVIPPPALSTSTVVSVWQARITWSKANVSPEAVRSSTV